MSERIALTGKSRENVERIVKQVSEMNQALNNYVQGIIDSKELEGTYQLDLKTFELVKQEKE